MLHHSDYSVHSVTETQITFIGHYLISLIVDIKIMKHILKTKFKTGEIKKYCNYLLYVCV